MTGSTHNHHQDDIIHEGEGVIPRALHQIFSTIKTLSSTASSNTVFNVRVSMIEIYNEECRDLLATCPGGEKETSEITEKSKEKDKDKEVQVREDKNGKVYLVGAKELSVTSLAHSLALLQHGNNTRSVGGTLMNTASSRSHVSTLTFLLFSHLLSSSLSFSVLLSLPRSFYLLLSYSQVPLSFSFTLLVSSCLFLPLSPSLLFFFCVSLSPSLLLTLLLLVHSFLIFSSVFLRLFSLSISMSLRLRQTLPRARRRRSPALSSIWSISPAVSVLTRPVRRARDSKRVSESTR